MTHDDNILLPIQKQNIIEGFHFFSLKLQFTCIMGCDEYLASQCYCH